MGLQYLSTDYTLHLVSAGHSGHRYFVKVYQHDPKDFARCGLYKEAGTNDNPVTWIFQVLLGAPDASTLSLPEVVLFSMKLCYDFQFAGHKAA